MSAVFPDPEDVGKIFVGGLSSSTTKESLCDYFSKFGTVVDSVVMTNNETGRSRGFGFVTFKDPSCVFKVLQDNYHELDGKKIDPKECTPRSMQKVRKQTGKCKVFLGGLSPNITEEDIRSGMSKFGKVDQVVIMYDQETKKCRGFGFLSFELEESIEQACAERYVIINGKQIECKKAEPRINSKSLKTYDVSNNGFVKQSPQLTAMHQHNWNAPNQGLFGLQGSPYPNYAAYATSPIASPPANAVSPGYTTVQAIPFMQPYPTTYGTPVASYNYTPVSTNTYQSNYGNAQAGNVSGQNTPDSNAGKSYAANDYSSSSLSYGPLRTFVGGNGTDAAYSTQSAVSASSYQRFHPYQSK